MSDSRDAEKQIRKIDNEIEELELKKKKLTNSKYQIYCHQCHRFYPKDECTQKPEFIFGGPFLESWSITCPKGHTWDDKD